MMKKIAENYVLPPGPSAAVKPASRNGTNTVGKVVGLTAKAK